VSVGDEKGWSEVGREGEREGGGGGEGELGYGVLKGKG
jgi:hypothetical protein